MTVFHVEQMVSGDGVVRLRLKDGERGGVIAEAHHRVLAQAKARLKHLAVEAGKPEEAVHDAIYRGPAS